MLEGAIITGAGIIWLDGDYYMAGWRMRGVCMLEGAIITGAGIIWLAGA